MADNISITAGSGTTIATDQVGTNHFQKVKLVDGTADSSTVIPAPTADPGSSSTVAGLAMRLAGSATVVGLDGTTARPFRMNSDGAIKVYDLVNGTVTANVSGSLTGITNTVTVKIDPAGAAFVNAFHTASIFTVSGSTSGGTTSGVTLVSPSANYNFKIFAYSIQTTGVVSAAIRFTNGAGSETELWRPLITAVASSSSPIGANLAVTPPGFIFATGVNTTLAIKNDSGNLIHYSVSYFKESA